MFSTRRRLKQGPFPWLWNLPSPESFIILDMGWRTGEDRQATGRGMQYRLDSASEHLLCWRNRWVLSVTGVLGLDKGHANSVLRKWRWLWTICRFQRMVSKYLKYRDHIRHQAIFNMVKYKQTSVWRWRCCRYKKESGFAKTQYVGCAYNYCGVSGTNYPMCNLK